MWYSTAAFVGGSQYLVAAYRDDKEGHLWDIAAAKVIRKFTGHTETGIGFAVSPDGKQLLSWSDDRTLCLWDVSTGKQLNQLKGHAEKASGVFSRDGKKDTYFQPR